jgi:glycosyltransferase involved in cell wall biosynthesis
VLPGSPLTVEDFVDVAEWERAGDAPLVAGARDVANTPSLHIAVVVSRLLEGSRSQDTIFSLVRELEARGQTLSVWVHDPAGRNAEVNATAAVRDWFGGMQGSVATGFDGWAGADVVVATGWQTAYRVLTLQGCKARAYLVLDHEPDFYPESAERLWADRTYRLGIHCITVGRWLRDLVTQNYGATASWFEPGIDHSVYLPQSVPRSDEVVLAASDAGASPLALLALADVKRERQELRIEMLGDVGVPDPAALAHAFSRAAVGVVLSLTSYPFVVQEMLACGLPCVAADTARVRAAFAPHDTVSLAPLTIEGIAGEVLRLLDDPALRGRRSAHGIEHVSSRTWEAAGEDFEGGLREALRLAAE